MSVALATIQGIITRHDEGLLSYEEALSQIYAEATKALMVLYPGEEAP